MGNKSAKKLRKYVDQNFQTWLESIKNIGWWKRLKIGWSILFKTDYYITALKRGNEPEYKRNRERKPR